MHSNESDSTAIDRASRSLPAYTAGGCLGGLLLGVLVDNIPYGAAGGLVFALFVWFIVAGRRAVKKAPDPNTDA
jgi:hypothetical protein